MMGWREVLPVSQKRPCPAIEAQLTKALTPHVTAHNRRGAIRLMDP